MNKSYLVTALLFVISFSVYSQVPGTIAYQGILMQSDGITPIADGSHTIVFSFYTGDTGGSALFSKTISVTTSKGLYTCVIGGGTGANIPLTASQMNMVGSQQVYIGITVDGGAELLPRAQLTTSPYSFRTQSVVQTANASGGTVPIWGTNNTLGSDLGLHYDIIKRRLSIGAQADFGTVIGWNKSNGNFETNIINNRGPGTGQFLFQTTQDGTSFTSLAQLTPTALNIFSGTYYGVGAVLTGGAYTGNHQITGSAAPTAPDAGIGSESAIRLVRDATGGVKNANTAEIKLNTFESGILGRGSLQFWVSGLPNGENTFGSVPEVCAMVINGFDGTGSDNRGYVGIGTQNPTTTLSVNGDANKASGGTTWGAFSDIRLKSDVKDFTDGLNVLMKVQPKTFRYNGLGDIKKSTKDEIGIIAQELQPVAPYMINTVPTKLHPADAEKTDLLMYDGGSSLIYVLVNSVKEQQAEIDALKKEMAEMRKLLESVKSLNVSTSTGK